MQRQSLQRDFQQRQREKSLVASGKRRADARKYERKQERNFLRISRKRERLPLREAFR